MKRNNVFANIITYIDNFINKEKSNNLFNYKVYP